MSTPAPEVTDTKTRLTDDPQWFNIIMIGLIGAVQLIAIVVATQGLYLAVDDMDQRSKDYGTNDHLYANQMQKQKAEMADYKYVDEAKGIVQIPVERGMELFLKEMTETKPVGSK